MGSIYTTHQLIKKGNIMKVMNSLKSWKTRGKVKLVRRGKRVYVINTDGKNPRLKARQGKKK
ncbi:MAG: 50S ribosomal protein L36 [Rickettsiaceae bacterium 4572_127]|nr:MAG: 50S ribosomal protein L36 [Rickettsiaceae bacterium 4572_127]